MGETSLGACWLNGIVSCELKRRGPVFFPRGQRFAEFMQLTGVGTRFAWFFFADFVLVSGLSFCLVEFFGDYISICFSCTSVFRWDLFGVIGCPKCKDVNLFRKQQAIYNFCLFLAFFFKRFEVSFACGVFRNPLKPSFCLSMQRVLKWKGEVPVSNISCVIASFFGDLIQYGNAGWNPTGTDEFLQVPRLSQKLVYEIVHQYCHVMPQCTWCLCEECILIIMITTCYWFLLVKINILKLSPNILTFKHWTLVLDNGRRGCYDGPFGLQVSPISYVLPKHPPG